MHLVACNACAYAALRDPFLLILRIFLRLRAAMFRTGRVSSGRLNLSTNSTLSAIVGSVLSKPSSPFSTCAQERWASG